MTIGNFKRVGKGIEFTIETTPTGEGAIPEGFDPWTFESEDPVELLSLSPKALAMYAAAQWILRNRPLIEASGPALLNAVAVVAKNQLIMPDWMAATYLARFRKIERMEVGSLDEVFGPLPPEFNGDKRRANNQRRRRLMPQINQWLVDRLNRNPEQPITKGLFEECGSAFGISATLAEELYREGVAKHRLQDIRQLKEMRLFPFNRK